MKKFSDIREWDTFPSPISRPLVIAGPCSVESEAQLYETAYALKRYGINVLRGGLWKPRTRPDSFEGVGEVGLQWMHDVGAKLGMKTATEVATAAHVEAALKHGIDILWIGARTSGNPFIVQEIADALKGSDIPVLIKNPIAADADLWCGAIERIAAAGIEKIGAVHRGFHSASRGRYRNEPLWHIPAEIRRRFPELPVFCDPSHIAGDRTLVEDICRQAMVLGFDGLMVESHCRPEEALSDAAQQLTPDTLAAILKNLEIRSADPSSTATETMQAIDDLRKSIDAIDSSLIDLLAQRMDIARMIGSLKETGGLSVLQPARWSQVLDRVTAQASTKGLDPDFIRTVFEAIHEAAMSRQIRK